MLSNVRQAKIIEKLGRSSQRYLEVQRKTHILLKDPEGLHYTAHLDNEALQAVGKHTKVKDDAR